MFKKKLEETISLDKKGDAIVTIDQTLLPNEERIIKLRTQEEIRNAIYKLKVRGAPAIGVCAAYGIYLGAKECETGDFEKFYEDFKEKKRYLASARPTAVNLFWALDQMEKTVLENKDKPVKEIKEELLKKADAIKEMVEASVRNFWMSILDGHLVVKIVDKVIDKDNLADYMERLFPSIVDETKTALRHNPRPYDEAYIHAGEDDNHKYFSKVIPHLGKVQFFAFLHSSANDRIIYMRDLRMFVYRKKNQTNAAFYGLFLCDDSHGNLLLRDMEPPRHDDWDPEFARKYPKEECRNAKDAYTQFIADCVKQLHPDDSNESLNVLGAQNAYIPESLIDEDNDEGMDSNAGQYGTGGQPTGEYQEEGTSMTTNIDDTTPDTPDTTKGTLGKVRRIDSNWEVDQDGKPYRRIEAHHHSLVKIPAEPDRQIDDDHQKQ